MVGITRVVTKNRKRQAPLLISSKCSALPGFVKFLKIYPFPCSKLFPNHFFSVTVKSLKLTSNDYANKFKITYVLHLLSLPYFRLDASFRFDPLIVLLSYNIKISRRFRRRIKRF